MHSILPMPVVWALLIIGSLLLLSVAALPILRILRDLWVASRGNVFGRYVFFAAVIGAAMYGGTKPSGGISYPYTDPEAKYLTDAGSYVTNDAIHVAFTRIIAPETAPLLIDRRQLDSTNDVDWVNFTNTTFAAFNQPQTIAFPAATNFNWIVYTTWTPGPTVQTNGVWHAYWGKDGKANAYFIPVRTCIRVDGEVIATPKSRWDAEDDTDTTNEDEQ